MNQKRKAGDDPLSHLDVRDLLGRFRSKRDIHEYLSNHCKASNSQINYNIVQLYLPKVDRVNKDFLKDVFAGRKHLIPLSQIRPIKVPDYDELSVKNLWPEVKEDKELSIYFPNDFGDKNLPPREFFFNIINTAQPDYLAALIKHAHTLRFTSEKEEQKKELIEVTDEWKTKLLSHPFYSSKLKDYNNL